MKQNIGLVNSMIRIACGLTMLAFFTAKFTRRPHKESYVFMMMIAALKVAEGIVRFCPITEIFRRTKEMDDMSLESIAKEGSSLNPS